KRKLTSTPASEATGTGRAQANDASTLWTMPAPICKRQPEHFGTRRQARVSTQTAHFFERPVYEHGFAVDGFALDETPGAAIAGRTAMVAQDEVLARRHYVAFPGNIVAVIFRNVILRQWCAVYINLAAVDPDHIPRRADDPLDVRLGHVQRKPEN